MSKGVISPLDVFRSLQSGISLQSSSLRRFLQAYFSAELDKRNLLGMRLEALNGSHVRSLVRELFLPRFLQVPVRVISLNIKLTGNPMFTDDGPTEDIIEIGCYCPLRNSVFSRIVQPKKEISRDILRRTGLTQDLIASEGVPFETAWQEMIRFVEAPQRPSSSGQAGEDKVSDFDSLIRPENDSYPDMLLKSFPGTEGSAAGESSTPSERKLAKNQKGFTTAEVNEAGRKSVWYDPVDIRRLPLELQPHTPDEHILMLSHGGKATDITVIDWSLRRARLELPPNYGFGDSQNIISELHHKRPVTQDKHPPNWNLQELLDWMKLPIPAHSSSRAGPSAIMTWSTLFHTLDRYGDDSLLPCEQLIYRFFEKDAIGLLDKNFVPTTITKPIAVQSESNFILESRENRKGSGDSEEEFDFDSVLAI